MQRGLALDYTLSPTSSHRAGFGSYGIGQGWGWPELCGSLLSDAAALVKDERIRSFASRSRQTRLTRDRVRTPAPPG